MYRFSKKEESKYIWKNSIFKNISTLEANNVGDVEKHFINIICEKCNIGSYIDGTKTKKKEVVSVW